MSLSRYAELLEQQRRLVILRALAEAASYSANTSLLADVVDHLGVPSSRAQVEGAVSWLAELGLVTCREIATVRIVQITERGLDVAAGRAVVPGIKRPAPTAAE